MSLRPWIRLSTLLVAGTLCGSLVAQDFYDRGTLRTLELQFAQADWDDQLRANKLAGMQQYIAGDLTIDGITYPNVGVRYKGNSTYWLRQGGQKAPIHIDMKAMGIDQEVYGHHKLILNNQWSDSSLMREVIAYMVMNEFTPSSRANFIKLIINGENYGIYTSIEHVGGKFTDRHFGNKDGFRYKAVPPDLWQDTITTPPPPADLALQWLNGNITRAVRAYELKNNETDPNAHLDVMAVIDVLENTSSVDMLATLDPLVDTDQAIWHMALINALCSLDAYYDSGRNYYLYHDSKHDRISIIPWDFNMAFGGYGNAPSTLAPNKGATDPTRPLYSKLVTGGVLRQEYLAHHVTIRERMLDPAILNAEIDALAALIDAEVRIDNKLGVNHTQWQNGLNQIKNFITGRNAFLLNEPLLAIERPEYTAVGHQPAQPASGQPVRFWAEVDNPNDPVEEVWAHYRAQGAFTALQLFDDGMHGDGAAGDGVYANTTPNGFGFGDQVEYYFRSKLTNSNGMRFEPAYASFRPLSFETAWGGSTSPLVLNEFVAKNNNGPVDEVGQAEDWIELYNRGGQTLDLSGMYMSDSLEELTKWAIPAGTMLAPGESLHIWADEDLTDGPMHADFKLSGDGEQLVLVSIDGTTILDYVAFGPQEADVATARLHDGSDLWVTTPDTTPFASNDLSCGVRQYNAFDPSTNLASLSISGTPQPGASLTATVSGLGPNQAFDLLVGQAPISLEDPISGLYLLLDQRVSETRLVADGTGSLNIPLTVPPQPGLVGQRFYLQAGARAVNPVATHAVEVVICP